MTLQEQDKPNQANTEKSLTDEELEKVAGGAKADDDDSSVANVLKTRHDTVKNIV